jgi:protein-S-isoprenylcysteine O-methyltransferase Ste14
MSMPMATVDAIDVPEIVGPAPVSVVRKWLTDDRLDAFERLFVLAFYGWLVWRIVQSYLTEGVLANLTLLPSEGLVVFFILIRRRPIVVSRRWAEWLLALFATSSVMMASPGHSDPFIPVAVGVVLMVCGMVVQVHAKVVLGRSFGCVPAHRGLKRSGPYTIVRHPMYAGYLLTHAAFLALNPTIWNLIVYAICYSLQIPRLLAEERLLLRDPEYRMYQVVVRYRLIPGLY